MAIFERQVEVKKRWLQINRSNTKFLLERKIQDTTRTLRCSNFGNEKDGQRRIKISKNDRKLFPTNLTNSKQKDRDFLRRLKRKNGNGVDGIKGESGE